MNDISSLRDSYDVIVIGSGLGGSTLAYQLGKHGLQVLVVEQGDYLNQTPRKPNEPVGIYIKNFANETKLVGGPSKFYGAAMYRMRESDFRSTQHEAGESPAWPISYADLEPYYCDVEQLYRVHGSPAGDRTEPPRSAAFPYPPLPHAPKVSSVVERLRNSGTCVSPMPRAIDYRAGGKCILCPTCDAHYCQLDAKMDSEMAALRPALATGNVKLLTRTECLQVLSKGKKATGALIQRDGKTQTIKAEIVAICAGLPGSARLLLQSQSALYPNGLGNSSGCVGRYFSGHTTGMIFPLIGITKLPAMHTKTFSINSFYEESPDWPYPTGVIQAAGQMPFWESASLPAWKKLAARLVGERSLYCFYMTEALATRESGYEFSNGNIVKTTPPLENSETSKRLKKLAIKTFNRAGYHVVAPSQLSLWHPVGTARFGQDPSSSVLDPTCKVHGMENLYVMDASVLPSAGAVNTGLTIAALALRVGDIIAGQKASVQAHETAQTSRAGVLVGL